MAIPYFLAISVVSHLLLLWSVSLSVSEQNNIKISCPSYFSCQDLEPFRFPLSNSTEYLSCGLFTVNCYESEGKQIQLGNGGIWYDIIGDMSQQDDNIHFQKLRLRIRSTFNEKQLKSPICHVFSYLSFSNSSSISYTLTPYTTFFKCNKSSSDDQHFKGFQNSTICEDDGYHLYYKDPADDSNSSTPAYLLRNCTQIQLPIEFDPSKLNPKQLGPSDVVNQFSGDFSLEMHVSKDCMKCHERGGQCQTENQEFHCTVKKASHLKVILCTAIPGGLFLLIGFLVYIIRRNKWNWNHLSSTFRLRNNTFGSKADIEENSIYFGISLFSYEELKEATNNFDPTKELGDGGFGTVYHGKLRDGREVAVKRLYEHNYKRVTQFLNEVEILTCIRHPNLVSLYGCTSRHSRELLLVYEYIPNGTVADHLHGDRAKNGQLTWPVRMNIAIETANALSYLHASDIIHRDVKTNNILLDDNFCVKVADFGLSRLFPLDVSHISTAPQGTPGYVDPEYHQCYQLTNKSDVYSFGVVLIELVSSMPAVDINRHRHEINLANLAVNRIQNRAFNELIDPFLGSESDPSIERMTTMVAEVAFRCLQLEKEMRPTMDEVLEALKEIQEYKDDNTGEEIQNVVGVLNRTRSSPSPEGDNVVLLRNSKVTSSPVSVADSWAISTSTASISSV